MSESFPIPRSRFISRRKKLVAAIKKEQLPALLVSNPTNVRYLTNFSGDSSYLIIGPSLCILVSDDRFTVQIGKECPDLDLILRTVGETINDAVGKVLKKAKISSIGFESTDLTVSQFKNLDSKLENCELVEKPSLVESLRKIKDKDEISEIRIAVHQAERAFDLARAGLRPEMTERDVRNQLESGMRSFGAEEAAFETIVAAGPNAAMAHARPGSSIIGESDFTLIDWGAKTPSGYHSDLTRIIATSKISPKLEKVYGVVLKAQQSAIQKIRPGIPASEIDQIARSIIADAKYGKKFGHALGHGIGLEIHEAIRLGPSSDELLEEGMVITVEPGIYLSGWGGVRIEDDVLVTKNGFEVLSNVTRDLEALQIHL